MRSLAAAPTRRRQDIPPGLLSTPSLNGLLRAAWVDWLCIVACWLLMARGPHWMWPLLVLLIAGRLHALGVVLHDACHMRRLPNVWQAHLLEVLAAYPITTTLVAMRYHHLRHHRHPCTALDPYFKPGASDRWIPAIGGRVRGLIVPFAWMLRAYLGCLAYVWPGLRNAYGHAFLGDRSSRDLRDSLEIDRCLRSEWKQALFFIALLPLLLAYPGAVVYGYVLPLCLAGLLNANRVIAEHLHRPVPDHRPATIVSSTFTHASNWLNDLLLYPRNIGYHAMHHLHPTTAMRCLPDLYAWYAVDSSATGGDGVP